MIQQAAKQNNTRTFALEHAIRDSWNAITPFWPLSSLIAVNPLSGWEHMEMEQALEMGQAYFQQQEIPKPMLEVNRLSIKWLQAYFDEGQATIGMPFREYGLFQCTRQLLPYDNQLPQGRRELESWFLQLPDDPARAIAHCLKLLQIPAGEQARFLTLMLTTLPGWAAHIQYRYRQEQTQGTGQWGNDYHTDYLAFRLTLTCLVWPAAAGLLHWFDTAMGMADSRPLVRSIEQQENSFRKDLLSKLTAPYTRSSVTPEVQMAFCIDVRSEPFRRALEQQGNYETFGMAGFFGIPVSIQNDISGEQYESCPVLLQPAHHVRETPSPRALRKVRRQQRRKNIKSAYLSMKNSFSAPFALVETLGLFSGIWMAGRTLFPGLMASAGKSGTAGPELTPSFGHIPLLKQSEYAESMLRMMGLTQNFAPLVVLCGHGSETQNNAFATALDCGACGGHHGGPNARIMAGILNQLEIRQILQRKGINIPAGTHFLAAQHNTTTDEVQLFQTGLPRALELPVAAFKRDLEKARRQNNGWRMAAGGFGSRQPAVSRTALRAKDWAEVRPEWGLAKNGAFIIAPRSATLGRNLEGRCFLHSYDWQQDPDGSILTTIMTAPMVVAQWINSQYLFSTLDNVAFGSGSKVTHNITGKLGVMQGNASDLMTGLPLQSVYESDHNAYHQPIRLLTVVYAPPQRVSEIIAGQAILQTLFRNGWVNLVCRDPETGRFLGLTRELGWQPWKDKVMPGWGDQ